MINKGKWRTFWAQFSEDPEVIGTLLCGTGIFIFEYLIVIFATDIESNVLSMLFKVTGGILLIILFVFIYMYARRAYCRMKLILSIKHVPVICVAGQPREEAEAAMREAQSTITRETGFGEFKQLENSLNISYNELIIHSRSRLGHESNEWTNLIKDAHWQIRSFASRVPSNKIYHVFNYGPSSLAIGLGAAFGTNHPLVAYQYIDGEYKPVIDLTRDIRRIKTTTSTENRYIKVSFPSQFTADTAVILHLATRDPRADVDLYLQRSKQKMAIVELINTYEGNLKDPDWGEAVREVFCVLTKIASTQISANKKVERIHLFHDMPVALAFGIGAALSTHTPIIVYNREVQEGTYYPVLTLNELDIHI